MFTHLSLRGVAKRYLESFIGIPYIWGGDDPSGWDCSGLVIEWLQGVGIFPRNADTTAHGLMKKYELGQIDAEEAQPMDLVFWLNDAGRAVHVETVWNPATLAVGASGGGSRTRTEEDANEANAFVKMRPIASRKGRRVYVDPFLAHDKANAERRGEVIQ